MRSLVAVCCLILLSNAVARQWDFSLHKHTSPYPGPTLLVIGGIQGDEPGGFNAASLLVTDYTIQRGELWVVPNLNFESIIKRSRGVHGDMNRKFKALATADPEYALVEKIKRIITDRQVDVILNLHDGSGFYHPVYIDETRNPRRWGQSLIIDQAQVSDIRYGNLQEIAQAITTQVNARLHDTDHRYNVKNTRTWQGNAEMEKTLTYYAIQRGKSAFGIEASKSFSTQQRAFYHLMMIESFMRYLGVEFQRSFELDVDQVQREIDNNVQLALYESRLFFDMRNVRQRLNYVPLKKNAPLDYAASNPLIAVVDNQQHYQVRYGNRHITELRPQYFTYDDSLKGIDLLIDGTPSHVRFGKIVDVHDTFQVQPRTDYRVNIIGYTRAGVTDEAGMSVGRRDIMPDYSVDQAARIFRVEVYRDNRFCGMVLVNFTDAAVTSIDLPPHRPDPHGSTTTDG